MGFTKFLYQRVYWKNKSESLDTPLGQTLLNRMDSAIYNIAENLNIVHEDFSNGKFDKADAGKVIVGMPTWNPNTGILSFRFYDGTTFQVDFNVEKIPVSFSMNSAGVITMTTSDGTEWTADIGDAIPDYEFDDSDTIAFSSGYNWDTSMYERIDEYGYGYPASWNVAENSNKIYLDKGTGIAYRCVYDGKRYFLVENQLQRSGKDRVYYAEVRKNSITGDHLQPNYLADITTQAGNVAASAKSASDSADGAAFDAKMAQSYAVGGSGVRQGEDSDNAKKYKELCQDIFDNLQQAGSVTGVKGDNETEFRHGNVSISSEDIGAIGAITNQRYIGMAAPNGDDSQWIRTTSSGLIPFEPGSNSALGTPDFHFASAYIDSIHGSLSGNASSATNANKVDGFHASSFFGNGTGYICPPAGGSDLNGFRTEYHGFVFNCLNSPANYGFLDVTYFDGVSFAPYGTGAIPVVRQIFTKWDTGQMWARTCVNGSWTAWVFMSANDYTSLSGRYVLRTATVSIGAGSSSFSGFYASGGSVTVGSFTELVVVSTTGINGWTYNWSYSGTTLTINVFKYGSSAGTVTVYFFTR